ncbi:DUF4840 domain-containing protein [Segatella bryantii]|uniref:DUF4840 domain-containing protein n=1 Tax=Segatella bryantii TaxID=77095 RepID=A0ABX4EGV1_SEGBR|nr:DUF4840 domain-containing protein [Segatella bryantii]OYP54864.1 hypothetical protein CIK91_08010 [Segatella bryantii]UKK82106.1 DUF4840 domain-containing protein [Segatella bryantii]
MKKLKVLSSILCCIMAAMAFTACNDLDHADNIITPEQSKQAMQTIYGIYHGKIIRIQENSVTNQEIRDTADVEWEVSNDSIMYIYNLPSKFLAKSITDDELKQAIEKQVTPVLKCYIGLVQLKPIAILINPTSPTFNVNYGGKEHKVQFSFALNNSYSYGLYTTNPKSFELQIINIGMYIDGKLQSSLMPNNIWYRLKYIPSAASDK